MYKIGAVQVRKVAPNVLNLQLSAFSGLNGPRWVGLSEKFIVCYKGSALISEN
jgi:hypothetical protein